MKSEMDIVEIVTTIAHKIWNCKRFAFEWSCKRDEKTILFPFAMCPFLDMFRLPWQSAPMSILLYGYLLLQQWKSTLPTDKICRLTCHTLRCAQLRVQCNIKWKKTKMLTSKKCASSVEAFASTNCNGSFFFVGLFISNLDSFSIKLPNRLKFIH